MMTVVEDKVHFIFFNGSFLRYGYRERITIYHSLFCSFNYFPYFNCMLVNITYFWCQKRQETEEFGKNIQEKEERVRETQQEMEEHQKQRQQDKEDLKSFLEHIKNWETV